MLGHPSSGVRTPRHDSEALVSGVVHGRPHELASDALSAEALGRLLSADVPVLAFELEGGRLSDAFLAMTETA